MAFGGGFATPGVAAPSICTTTTASKQAMSTVYGDVFVVQDTLSIASPSSSASGEAAYGKQRHHSRSGHEHLERQ
jgi:hypothetical protein